jgi:CMP-N,N'-diacetyllegionaminic acid synthase
MKKRKTFICLIPARGGSKGILNKNIISLDGKPLISYVIETSIKSGIFDRIIVTTDSKRIAEISKQYGAEVPFMRPKELSTDKSLVEDTMVQALKYLEINDKRYDYVCLIQPTSPLVLPEDIQNSFNILISKKADMVVSVGESPINVRWARSLPEDMSMKVFSNNVCGTNKQCFENVHYLNGAIYMGKWDIFYNKKDYYRQNSYAYVMPYERSIDIDNLLDLKIVDFLVKDRKNVK